MNAKHTPGPWAWHESEESLIGRAGVHIIKDYGSYEGLAINDWDRLTEDEAAANKLLIAAAPELLAALKAAMAFIDSNVADPDITDEMAKAYAALKDADPHGAISKAQVQS